MIITNSNGRKTCGTAAGQHNLTINKYMFRIVVVLGTTTVGLVPALLVVVLHRPILIVGIRAVVVLVGPNNK